FFEGRWAYREGDATAADRCERGRHGATSWRPAGTWSAPSLLLASAQSGVRITIQANSPPSSGTSCCAREDHWQSCRRLSSPRHIAAIRSSRVIAHSARYASHRLGRWWRPDPICVDAPPALVRAAVV